VLTTMSRGRDPVSAHPVVFHYIRQSGMRRPITMPDTTANPVLGEAKRLAFSKELENHGHMVALHFMHYNFARVHKS